MIWASGNGLLQAGEQTILNSTVGFVTQVSGQFLLLSCFCIMGPDHVPLPCLEEVVVTSFTCWVFLRWPPKTSRSPGSGRLFLESGWSLRGRRMLTTNPNRKASERTWSNEVVCKIGSEKPLTDYIMILNFFNSQVFGEVSKSRCIGKIATAKRKITSDIW